jgi:hypothetical protein
VVVPGVAGPWVAVAAALVVEVVALGGEVVEVVEGGGELAKLTVVVTAQVTVLPPPLADPLH